MPAIRFICSGSSYNKLMCDLSGLLVITSMSCMTTCYPLLLCWSSVCWLVSLDNMWVGLYLSTMTLSIMKRLLLLVTSHYFSLLLVFYVSPLIIDRFYWVYWYLFMAIGIDLYLGVLLMYWVYLTSISHISYLPVLDAYSLIAYLNDIVHLLFSHKNRDGVNHLLFLSLLRYVFR